MVAVPEAIEVFVVTGSERTQTIDSFGPTNAGTCHGLYLCLPGAHCTCFLLAAATSFTTQPKIEPAVIPSALHEIGASAVAATLDAESGSEEATFEEDEAHGARYFFFLIQPCFNTLTYILHLRVDSRLSAYRRHCFLHSIHPGTRMYAILRYCYHGPPVACTGAYCYPRVVLCYSSLVDPR